MPYINYKDWMNNYYEAGEPKPRFGYETYPPLPKIIKKIKRKMTKKNIEIHFTNNNQVIEMIYDFEKKDFVLNSPGQEMVCFENMSVQEAESTLKSIQDALTYIKKHLYEDSPIRSNNTRTKNRNKKSIQKKK